MLFLAGCSHPSGTVGGAGKTFAMTRALSPKSAAALAARLANEQCAQRYHREPFLADQNIVVLRDGKYSWGGLNEGGAKGFSARVTFDAEGRNQQVEVFYSNDAEIPDRSFFEDPVIQIPDFESDRL